VKGGTFLPDILLKKTVVLTNASCRQCIEFFNVKTEDVGRNLCALQCHSNLIVSIIRKRYLPRLQDPTTKPDVYSPSRLLF